LSRLQAYLSFRAENIPASEMRNTFCPKGLFFKEQFGKLTASFPFLEPSNFV